MADLSKATVDECNDSWDKEFIPGLKNSDNCSGFVKAVAKKLGVPIPDTANADSIVEVISKNWVQVPSGAEAARHAGTGVFVLAGLKSGDHTPPRNNGHVAIVVPGDLYRGIYPKVWCGSTGAAQSKGDKSVGEVWNRTDRDNVGYYQYTSTSTKK